MSKIVLKICQCSCGCGSTFGRLPQSSPPYYARLSHNPNYNPFITVMPAVKKKAVK